MLLSSTVDGLYKIVYNFFGNNVAISILTLNMLTTDHGAILIPAKYMNRRNSQACMPRAYISMFTIKLKITPLSLTVSEITICDFFISSRI